MATPATALVVVLCTLAAGAACTVDAGPAAAPRSSGATRVAARPPATRSPATEATLSSLVVDDRPAPDRPYDRAEWPHWNDPDGNRCDAREDALIAQATTRPQVDPIDCSVVAGDWVSPYDGVPVSDPGELDVDHLVALEDAHTSGGWRWTLDQRRGFANDPDGLVVVTAAANRSKGSRTPDEWLPPDAAHWCTYARGWVRIKARYALTVTTPERDALGELLDTCPAPP